LLRVIPKHWRRRLGPVSWFKSVLVRNNGVAMSDAGRSTRWEGHVSAGAELFEDRRLQN